MDETKLKRLIRLVEASDIDELEIDRPLERIRITKRRAVEPSAVATAPAVSAPPAPVEVPKTEVVATAPQPAPPERDPGVVAVVAPMVGTFYASPAPGARPYLTTGDSVQVGQVVCIVEAMKLMNEVQSEVAGRVTKICVDNGQAVEYGQELFLVAPA